jgi:hypothetical protein
VANGGEQDCCGALTKVVERRRKREGEIRPREEEKKVEQGSWTRCKTKRSHGRVGSNCWRPAAVRRGWTRKMLAGSGECWVGELEARWCG